MQLKSALHRHHGARALTIREWIATADTLTMLRPALMRPIADTLNQSHSIWRRTTSPARSSTTLRNYAKATRPGKREREKDWSRAAPNSYHNWWRRKRPWSWQPGPSQPTMLPFASAWRCICSRHWQRTADHPNPAAQSQIAWLLRLNTHSSHVCFAIWLPWEQCLRPAPIHSLLHPTPSLWRRRSIENPSSSLKMTGSRSTNLHPNSSGKTASNRRRRYSTVPSNSPTTVKASICLSLWARLHPREGSR